MPDRNDTATTGEATSPYLPTFDTGGLTPQPDPVKPLAAEPEPAFTFDYEPLVFDPPAEFAPVGTSAHPVAVPGSYQYLKRWAFVLILAGVWLVAAAIGVGLYYLWFHDPDVLKTWPVFGVFMYLIVSTGAGLLISMVQNRPMLSALAIALMSAPMASTAGAAALYGAYVFGWIAR